MAGTWDWVKVDGSYISNGGDCNLVQGVWVEGVYSPVNPHDADIAWRINSGSWHDEGEVPGANGKVGFGFEMTELTGLGDTLYIRAVEEVPNPDQTYEWSCS